MGRFFGQQPQAAPGAPVYGAAYLQPWNASTTKAYTGTMQGAASFTGSISGTVLTVTAMTNGQLLPGQTITGTGVTAATTISSQASGATGGVGTYNLNNSMTVASEAMTSTATPAAGATLHNWYDAGKFVFFGGARAGSSGTSANFAYNPTDPSNSDQYVPQFIEFDFTGSSFQIVQQIVSANGYGGIKLFINGVMQTQYCELSAQGSCAANDLYMLNVDFGSSATRKITIWMDYGFKGIYASVAPTASTRTRNGKKLAILADSWYNGGNAGVGGATIAGCIADNNCLETALQTGHDEVIVLAEPGTGWMNDGTNTQLMTAARTPFYATRRLQAIIAHNPATVLAIGSVNDIVISGYNTGTAAKVTQALNYLIANLSQYTNIFIGGGQYVNLNTKAQYTPIDSQLTSGIGACSAPMRPKQIICTSDNTVNGTPWINGTGNTTNIKGDGNSDTYLNSDGKHLNRMGQYFWAGQLAGRMNSLGV